MEIILLERVENLGQMGDVVSVKDGYARNFLLPRKKALRATDANKKQFEAQKTQLEAENLKKREEAQHVAERMGKTEVVILRQAGEMGQLYGSVNARDVADALNEAGIKISRNQVSLKNPIKTLGLFDVAVVLHPEVVVTVTANVARSADEAEIQRTTGGAIVTNLDEDEFDAVVEIIAEEEDNTEAEVEAEEKTEK
ncbi:MAG: 50S ribosomal protein L9 [Alphaproteobacteria bacterium]